MRLEKEWLEAADQALLSTEIVENGQYRKPFKGYFSSYGAAIVQSGLLAASSFFEGESESAQDRPLVVEAVVKVLRETGCIREPIESLAFYYYGLSDVNGKNRLLLQVDKAIAALKQALRQYDKETEKEGRTFRQVSFGKTVKTKGTKVVLEQAFVKQYEWRSKENSANLGWLYYRNYYRKFTFTPMEVKKEEKNGSEKKMGNELELYFRQQNDRMTSFSCVDFKGNKSIIEALSPTHRLCFKTVYPGLLIGSGLSHGTGVTNDMKIGFSFDYTTGLPYIPGSSVKGVLRSMFPQKEPEAKNPESMDLRKVRYIRETLKELSLTDKQVWQLTRSLFEAYREDIAGAARSVYFDALIVNSPGQILGDDFITPHTQGITKNPVPLQFLKVLPDVTFCFSFKLADWYSLGDGRSISGSDVCELFKNILLDTGVGAKTNVGYGNLRFDGEKW